MNIENVKRIVNMLHSESPRDIFGALMIYEEIENNNFFENELETIDNGIIDYLNALYETYLKVDGVNLINTEEIMELEVK